MSVRLKEANIAFDRLEVQLQQSQYVYDGASMVKQSDRATWGRALTMWYIVLQDTSLCSIANLEWIFSVATLDALSVGKALKKAASFIVRRFEDDEWIPWADFIHQPGIADVADPLFRPIDGLMRYWDRRNPLTTDELRDCRQFTCFLLHTTLSCIDTRQAIDDYIDHDAAVVETPPPVCERLNRILLDWLKGFSVLRYPAHGSGATSDGLFGGNGNHSVFAKDLMIETDQLLEYVVGKYGTWSMSEVLPFGAPRHKSRHFKINKETFLVTVPKTLLGPRIISEEPTSLMFFQQAVMKSLYDFLGDHRYLSRRIPLRNQMINRRRAQEGSRDGSLVTIDLSHASDSVGWNIVKRCFLHTSLYPWLVATRSARCALPYGIMELKKFANMGSALTFPVESLLFAAVCEDACRELGVNGNWSVYGDDIICTRSVFTRVLETLGSLGFVVNLDKSFVSGDGVGYCFRESCGGEYLNGVDITPLRISRKMSGMALEANHPEAVLRFVELANDSLANCHCYLMLRQWLIHQLLTQLPCKLWPGFGPGASQINCVSGEYTPFYRRIIRRYEEMPKCEPFYGSAQIKVGVPRPCRKSRYDDDETEPFRLFHWFLAKADQERSTGWVGSDRLSDDGNRKVTEIASIGPAGPQELVDSWVDPALAK